MAFNKADVIASAQSYGPKGPNKIVYMLMKINIWGQ